jgi:hypothetical protein
MRTYISGGRGDGSDWPPAGSPLECGEQEARDLVRAELAHWADDAEPAAEGAEPVADAPGASDPDGEPLDGEEDSEGDDGTPDEDPDRPGVRAPKQDWVDYATAHRGCHPARAAEMTKSDLLKEFGRQTTP